MGIMLTFDCDGLELRLLRLRMDLGYGVDTDVGGVCPCPFSVQFVSSSHMARNLRTVGSK